VGNELQWTTGVYRPREELVEGVGRVYGLQWAIFYF
jgi:hypothetical protein